MKIEELLSPTDIALDVELRDKQGVLLELAHRAAAPLLIDSMTIFETLMAREKVGSTGMGGGIAIPHARLAQVSRPYGFLLRLRPPVDFDAVDGDSVDLVFLLLLSLAPGKQLNALACVARHLRDPATLERLRTAPDTSAAFRALVDQEHSG
jgi:nitrogen PTS system EIIA component